MKITPLVIGSVVWLVILSAVGYLIYLGVNAMRPQATMLLSVAVEFRESEGLVVEGRAFVDSEPVSAGRVKLAVQRLLPPLHVTLIEEIREGKFVVSGSPYLASFTRGNGIVVHAEAWAQKPRAATGQEDAFWNIGRWMTWIPWVVLPTTLLMAVALSILFTGQFTRWKNRCAISLTYLAITFFLSMPFLVPFAMSVFPDARDLMAKSPVGFIEVGKANKIDLNQWALNIGGIPHRSGDGQPYDVGNGLVIPVYVLILALLGGAINMTRKVPKLQVDMDAQINLVKLGGPIQKILLLRPTTAEPVAPPPLAPPTEQEQLDQQKRQAEVNRLRGDLINQHMYLITAPFLAIVVYYLLSIVNKDLAESTSILVLMAFCSGLISESVLSTITGYADGYLQRLKTRLGEHERGAKRPPVVASTEHAGGGVEAPTGGHPPDAAGQPPSDR